MNDKEIKNALESLHNPDVHNQALIDCKSLLNLSKETLENHFQQWLWVEAEKEAYTGADLFYYLQLAPIEEYLIKQGLIYDFE